MKVENDHRSKFSNFKKLERRKPDFYITNGLVTNSGFDRLRSREIGAGKA